MMLDIKKWMSKVMQVTEIKAVSKQYSNVSVPSGLYVKIDSLSDLADASKYALTAMYTKGWSGVIPIDVVLGSNGNDVYVLGRSQGTINSMGVVYIFRRILGGVLLSSIFKAFSHLQKIGGGVNVRPQETDREDSGVAERSDRLSGVHSVGLDNDCCSRCYKQERSLDGTDRILGSLCGESKTKRSGRPGISGRRNIWNKREHHSLVSKRINSLTDDILCDDRDAVYKGRIAISERGWAAC